MTSVERLSYLRISLVVAALACFALYPLMVFWPSGWTWHTGHSHYPMMLGVFLVLAARDPLSYLSLIRFTVWSCVVHGAIMAVQAVTDHEQLAHLWGDVPALFIVAIVLGALTPRGEEASALPHTARQSRLAASRQPLM